METTNIMKRIKTLFPVALLGLFSFCESVVSAQAIQWLHLTINTSSADTVLLPNSSGSNPSGTWIVTNLACYGNVLITQTFPTNVTDYITPALENVPNASGNFVNMETGYGPYSWGPCAELNFYNTIHPAVVETYTVNFYFLNGPPANFSLFLAVGGLAFSTTATVSQPVIFRGEYDAPTSAYTSITNQPYDSSVTTGVTNAGTVGTIVGSYYNTDYHGDPINTGWALFQAVSDLATTNLPTGSGAGYPPPGAAPFLSLTVSQKSGDSIGFSLGYICFTNVCTNGCITIYSPNDIVATTCSNSLPVDFSVFVKDDCCSNCVTLDSNPQSGYDFPLGTTTVTNTAIDSLGNTDICTFTVTVLPNTDPPVFTACPSNVVICISSNSCGIMPDETPYVQAVTAEGQPANIMQSIMPGELVCSDTNVTFTATDGCGDATNRVVPCVLSNCCLQIECHSNIVASTCSNSLPVYYSVNAFDECCSNCLTLKSIPPSGYDFPPGTTTVTNIASDGLGDTNICTFTVTVIQNTNAPIIYYCPTNIIVSATNGCTTVPDVTGLVVATTAAGGPALVTQDPAAGIQICSMTNITVTVADACGHTTNCSVLCILVSNDVLTFTPVRSYTNSPFDVYALTWPTGAVGEPDWSAQFSTNLKDWHPLDVTNLVHYTNLPNHTGFTITNDQAIPNLFFRLISTNGP